jgi:diguanylate cyclase (GGDEF)-like protein
VQSAGSRAVAAAVTVLAAYGLWQIFRWGGREHQALIGDLAFIPVNGAAALMAWRASQRAGLGSSTCRAWRLLAIALLLYLVGDLLQLVYEAVLHKGAYPNWGDAAYLAFYPVAFWGLISFPGRRRSGPERLRLLLDTGMVFTGGATLVWYVSLGPAIMAGRRFSDLLDLVDYAYPVGDLLLLFGTLAVLLRGAPQSSVLALRIFAIGVVAYIAADLTYDYITARSAYMGGDPVDMLWMLALTIMCLAAACQFRTKPPGIPEPLPRPAAQRPSLLPYLAIVSCYALLVVVGLRSVRFDSLTGGLLAGAVALTFLVSARQHVTVHDYGRLAIRYQELASVDGVTGVFNRRHFMEAAEAAVARAQGLGQPLVALMMDVDNFKEINDTHGHSAGDQVLTEMAQACREHVRPADIVGRYGGDEFVILIDGITTTRAAQIAGQLARPATHVHGRDGKPLSYSASIGIAESLPGWDLPALLAHADAAMYEAKRAGGGSWRISEDAEPTQAVTLQAAALRPRKRPTATRHQARPWLHPIPGGEKVVSSVSAHRACRGRNHERHGLDELSAAAPAVGDLDAARAPDGPRRLRILGHVTSFFECGQPLTRRDHFGQSVLGGDAYRSTGGLAGTEVIEKVGDRGWVRAIAGVVVCGPGHCGSLKGSGAKHASAMSGRGPFALVGEAVVIVGLAVLVGGPYPQPAHLYLGSSAGTRWAS